MPHPDVFWYRLKAMGAQKNAPKIFHIYLKTKIVKNKKSKNINKKQKSFQETQISFPKCIEHQIFLDTQPEPLGVFGYH